MTQSTGLETVAITSDGQPIFPAAMVAPGSPQPLGVLPDGQPVWPVPYGTVPPGGPVPYGLTSEGAPVWAKAAARVDSRPGWKRKRVLIPAGVFALFVVAGIAGAGDDTTNIRTASDTADAAVAAPVDPAQAAADKAAADKAAADKAAAAEQAAADKAAADAKKAEADKAAAEKAAAEQAAADKAAAQTAGQKNAARAAENYLSFAPFSRSGLIEQLEFEGYSTADATHGVDSQNADWNAQAAKAAQNYLDMTAFSRSGLIEQLEFEGYTREQATYGADQAGL